jgi:hypothetical protein
MEMKLLSRILDALDSFLWQLLEDNIPAAVPKPLTAEQSALLGRYHGRTGVQICGEPLGEGSKLDAQLQLAGWLAATVEVQQAELARLYALQDTRVKRCKT